MTLTLLDLLHSVVIYHKKVLITLSKRYSHAWGNFMNTLDVTGMITSKLFGKTSKLVSQHRNRCKTIYNGILPNVNNRNQCQIILWWKDFYSFLLNIANVLYFDKNENATTQNLPYDFGSCMHIRFDAYSKNKRPTMVPKDDSIPKEIMGASKWPSDQDYLDINLSYCGKTKNLSSMMKGGWEITCKNVVAILYTILDKEDR